MTDRTFLVVEFDPTVAGGLGRARRALHEAEGTGIVRDMPFRTGQATPWYTTQQAEQIADVIDVAFYSVKEIANARRDRLGRTVECQRRCGRKLRVLLDRPGRIVKFAQRSGWWVTRGSWDRGLQFTCPSCEGHRYSGPVSIFAVPQENQVR